MGVFGYSRRALELVWQTSPRLTVAFAFLSVWTGVLPAGIAYVGKLLMDALVASLTQSVPTPVETLAGIVALELGLVLLRDGGVRALSFCESLLRAQMGHRINVMILEKASALDLAQFENPDFYDKLTRSRREASSRPLSLVTSVFQLFQRLLTLATLAALIFTFSPWAVLAIVLGSLPAFVAETKYSGEAFRIYRWRTPERRRQVYLEAVLAREDYAKEVSIFGLSPHLLERYKKIFDDIYEEDRDLAMRRSLVGFLLGVVKTLVLYGVLGWLALETWKGNLGLGDMTMLVAVFRQAQGTFQGALRNIAGMYEDNLYLSNLYELLDAPVETKRGGVHKGEAPGRGFEFQDVAFTYPGAEVPALQGVSFQLRPGEKLALVGENGSGKTTLIKLLARLYHPSAGKILLDGTDLEAWDAAALRARIGVIFQDFNRYQFPLGENISVGDIDALEDHSRRDWAAEKGMVDGFLHRLPEGFETQLGRWFPGGVELSMGQWQKVALARAFMRSDADIFVLDEPTASMDPEAEAKIFEHFRVNLPEKMAIFISHRFSTVRMADRILVLDEGKILEDGSHDQLLQADGRYAHLFQLQARGYA